jgi:hypothetical protein
MAAKSARPIGTSGAVRLCALASDERLEVIEVATDTTGPPVSKGLLDSACIGRMTTPSDG